MKSRSAESCSSFPGILVTKVSIPSPFICWIRTQCFLNNNFPFQPCRSPLGESPFVFAGTVSVVPVTLTDTSRPLPLLSFYKAWWMSHAVCKGTHIWRLGYNQTCLPHQVERCPINHQRDSQTIILLSSRKFIQMASKTSEPSIGTDVTTKHVLGDLPKIPLGPSRSGRQKRGPPGRETTHPIPQQGISQASRKRGPEGRETTHALSQAVQSAVLSGQRPQAASEKSEQ